MKYEFVLGVHGRRREYLTIEKSGMYKKFQYLIALSANGDQLLIIGIPPENILYNTNPDFILQLECVKNRSILIPFDFFESNDFPYGIPGIPYHWMCFTFKYKNNRIVDTLSGRNNDPEILMDICKGLIDDFSKDYIK